METKKDIIEELLKVQKSLKENCFYDYLPKIEIICTDDLTETEKQIHYNGLKYAVRMEDFEGYGDTVYKAYKCLINNYKNYVKYETEFEDKMMEFFEELEK